MDSLLGRCVLEGALGEEAGAVIRGAALRSGVPNGLETGWAVVEEVGDDFGEDIGAAPAVDAGATVALGEDRLEAPLEELNPVEEDVTPVVVVLLTPVLTPAANCGTGTP